MAELMRLYNTDLRSASDTLLDLGTPDFRWKNLYLSGTQTAGNIISNSVNTVVFIVTGSSTQVGVTATALTVSTAIITRLTVTSASITSQLFVKSVGSSLVLSNSARSYLNVQIMTHNAITPVSGDVWFQASSNTMYVAIRSNNADYFLRMDT